MHARTPWERAGGRGKQKRSAQNQKLSHELHSSFGPAENAFFPSSIRVAAVPTTEAESAPKRNWNQP